MRYLEQSTYAVKDKNLVEGSTKGFDIRTGYTNTDGSPTCNPAYSRYLYPDSDYSGCDGGADKRYHYYFLLDPSWGTDVMAAGYTFGFPDYLDDGKNYSMCSTLWLPPNHPDEFVIKPGDYGAYVPAITEIETWMLRYM
ncbi:uncharacterized protein K452DRAFT_355623 [Aplosporella prunicola CBS 121167]|uniref:Uncharacterized protein n=1 Tax=Aplosporella prunicola CBS 121167 TaxID=1176127 RepID=A0A6A6BQ06_9PEZI|nr:uncharacterized protein K452DRAFT_355623 [Aplosporella prunicola CBS 121167]KAF2146176.1 hypothetical protein K452DRAFT_355623 [Aplosporella prunicola CBS 121167]